MRFLFVVLASALTAWAQSPHVYRSNKLPKFSVRGEGLTIDFPEANANASAYNWGLFGRQGTNPTPKEQEGRRPPAFPLPDCFWCPPQAMLNGDAWKLLATFTTDEFERRSRASPADLRNTCMFYTKAVTNPAVPLSRRATQLACKFEKYSIWHLWPNVKNEANNPALLNFYGVYDSKSRLYPLSQLPTVNGKPGIINYFENMSRAMANMCTGRIHVLTDTPFDLNQYFNPPYAPNIFGTTEIPALRAHLSTLNDLVVIDNQDTANQPRAWKVDWQTLFTDQNQPVTNWKRENSTEGEEVLPSGYEPYDLGAELNQLTDRELKARAGQLCGDDGLADEPAGKDFFG